MRGIPCRRRLSVSAPAAPSQELPIDRHSEESLGIYSLGMDDCRAVGMSGLCDVPGVTTALTPMDQCVPVEARSSCWHQLANAHNKGVCRLLLNTNSGNQDNCPSCWQTMKVIMEWSDEGLKAATRARVNSSEEDLGDWVRGGVSSAKHLWLAAE